MEQEMRPYYAPGYSGHSSIKTLMLTGGKRKHTMEGWIGYSNPNEGMDKTKWRRTDVEYWNVQSDSKSKPGVVYTYTVTKNTLGSMACDCLGYRYHKDCKHINEVKNLINK